MRDIIVTIIVFGALPYVFVRPHLGIYLWSWIGYMSPHRLGWGFAYDFPFAAIIGGVTIMATLFSKEKKGVPWNAVTIVLILFIAWMTLTTMFATVPGEAVPQLIKVLKIQLVIFLTLVVITTRERLIGLIWIIVLSIGYYGVKGGVFAILTGGNFSVLGPKDTFIEGNTSLALALIMVLPLMWFLQSTVNRKILKYGMRGAMVLTIFAIAASYSRGAFLAGGTIALFLVLKSRKKLMIGAILLAMIPVVLVFMPDKWSERMGTIQTYEQDSSAMGRITAWQFAFDMAKARFLGGGFDSFVEKNYFVYSPDTVSQIVESADGRFQDAHSIYFEVLGEHGFVGLILFLSLGLLAWRLGKQIIQQTSNNEELKWMYDLAAMVQVSLVGYAVGGAFLGLAYFDLYYHLVIILVITQRLMSDVSTNTVKQEENSTQELGRMQKNRPYVKRKIGS